YITGDAVHTHTIQYLLLPCLMHCVDSTHHSGSFSSSFGARQCYHAPFRILFVLVWGTADAPRIMQVLFHHSLGRGLPVHHLRLVLCNKNLLSKVYSTR